jgi:MoaA/NifB/PqqE/SkfB family radical SAM enzyme
MNNYKDFLGVLLGFKEPITSLWSVLKGLFAHSSALEVPIQIDITNACNLNCSHCYHTNHINNGALEINQWFEILAQYKSLILTSKAKPAFLICGGEPLVSPHLFSLIFYS